jgi:DNA-binding Xre family transcriptional regulator
LLIVRCFTFFGKILGSFDGFGAYLPYSIKWPAMMNDQEQQLAEIGGRIRKARKGNGLNLHELARLSGISAPALSLIENGMRDLRVTSLRRIAAALRVAAGDLLEGRPADAPTAKAHDKKGYDLGDYT